MAPRRIELPEEKSTLPSKTIREWGAMKYVVDEGVYGTHCPRRRWSNTLRAGDTNLIGDKWMGFTTNGVHPPNVEANKEFWALETSCCAAE
jgi:hypothetical protein